MLSRIRELREKVAFQMNATTKSHDSQTNDTSRLAKSPAQEMVQLYHS